MNTLLNTLKRIPLNMLTVLAMFLLAANGLIAQMPGGMPPGGAGAAANGHVYGKITDTAGKPLGDVSVVLLQSRTDAATKKTKDVLLKGATTKNNGEFSFEELPTSSPLKLKISISGYKSTEQTISLRPAAGGPPLL